MMEDISSFYFVFRSKIEENEEQGDESGRMMEDDVM